MNAQLDFPVIQPEPEKAGAVAKLSIKETVLAQFREHEPEMRAVAAKFTGVAFDCTTTKGMDAAKAARLEIRESRFKVQRAEERIKKEVNGLKRDMSDEVERLSAILLPVEDHVDGQIKAEESRKAAEKAERERLAAERKALHDGKIAGIRACVGRAEGLPSDRIANGIAQVEALSFGEDCAEFLPQYEAAKAETLEAMRRLLADAQAREAAEAQRLENERVAAELERQRQELAAQASEIARQKAEHEAAELRRRVAETHAIVLTFPEPDHEPFAQAIEQVEAPTPTHPVEPAAALTPEQAWPLPSDPEPEAAAPAAPAAEPTPAAAPAAAPAAEVVWIKTSDVAEALGLLVSADFLAAVGYPGTKRAGPGMWWDEARLEDIQAALAVHSTKALAAYRARETVAA